MDAQVVPTNRRSRYLIVKFAGEETVRTWHHAPRVAVLAGVAAFAAGLAWAADHREAPAVSQRPGADINDIYAFRDALDRLVLVMTVNPLSDPDFAGSYAFDPRVLYRFSIDNTGDAIGDRHIDVVFGQPTAPGVQRLRARFPGGLVVSGGVTPPSRADDPIIVSGPPGSDISIFAGPRDDPFFFDAVGFNRVRAGDPEGFRGIDSFAGFNVSAIVIALPAHLVSDGRSQLQISGFTVNRQPNTFRIIGPIFDRTGNPAVSTALIPFAQRDAFNRGLPRNDAQVFGATIVSSLEAFGTPPGNIEILASVAVPDTLKLDLFAEDGFPNGRWLEDDVIDILLGLILPAGPTSDGVDSNDKPFLDSFPFLAPPHQPES